MNVSSVFMIRKYLFYLLLLSLFLIPVFGLITTYAQNSQPVYTNYDMTDPFYKGAVNLGKTRFNSSRQKSGYSTLTLTLLALFLIGGIGISVHERLKRKNRSIAAAIKTAYSMQNKYVTNFTERELRKRDPDFSKTVLQERIWQAFKQVQIALDSRDFGFIRHFVSDGVYEQLTIQETIRNASSIKNEKRNIDIRNVRIVFIESDRQFDVIHCQITAQAVDYFVNNETQKVVYAQNHPGVFTEYWSFMRHRDVKTLKKPGLFEGRCPKCDTKLQADSPSRCLQCKTIVNSGVLDWVLADIKSSSEWSLKPLYKINYLDELEAKDPLFSVQHIIDKTTVTFNRFIAACFFAKNDYLCNFTTAEFLEKNKTLFTPLKDGRHSFYADAMISAIDLFDIVLDKNDSFDYVKVKVKWSGHRETAKVPSYIKPAFEESNYFIQQFTFKRSASAKTSTMNLLNSTHCSTCGTFNDTFICTCQECRSQLTNNSQDWLLCDISDLNNPFEQENILRVAEYKLRSINNIPFLAIYDSEALFANIIYITLSSWANSETIELLTYFARINKIQSRKINALVKNSLDYHVPADIPDNPVLIKSFIRAIILMCLIDGKIAPIEEKVLEKLSTSMGHSTWDIRLLINQERKALYKQAKKVIHSLNARKRT